MKSLFCPASATALALLLAILPAAVAGAQETVDGVALDDERADRLGGDPEPWAIESRPTGVLDRYNRRGAGMPRVTYQMPPFEDEKYWVSGGILRVDDPALFLMPLDVRYLYDGAGQMGFTLETRLWGNALWSWGMEFWGVAEPSEIDGIFQKAPRVNGVWRLQTDFAFLGWMDPTWGFEIGLLLGVEKDILTTRVQHRDIAIIWGFSGRLTVGRFQLRTDWLMRIDDDRDLGYGQLRHAMRAELEFEVFRVENIGFVVGYWTYVVTGGKPRAGFNAGVRIWFAPGRSKPDWSERYRPE